MNDTIKPLTHVDITNIFRTDHQVSRAVAEAIVDQAKDHAIDGKVRLTELIHIANAAVGWTATEHLDRVKASALRDAARAQREIARNSSTKDGRYEAEGIADWLDERAELLDPPPVPAANHWGLAFEAHP